MRFFWNFVVFGDCFQTHSGCQEQVFVNKIAKSLKSLPFNVSPTKACDLTTKRKIPFLDDLRNCHSPTKACDFLLELNSSHLRRTNHLKHLKPLTQTCVFFEMQFLFRLLFSNTFWVPVLNFEHGFLKLIPAYLLIGFGFLPKSICHYKLAY